MQQFLHSKLMHGIILILVLLNSVILGLLAMTSTPDHYRPMLQAVDGIVIFLLAFEIILRISASKLSFFRRGWNTFDFAVVTLSLIGYLSDNQIIGGLRVLLLFRFIEFFPGMKLLTKALLKSFGHIFSSIVMLFLIYYTFALIGRNVYGTVVPEAFGDLHVTFLSLFQIMLFDDFGAIAGPMLEFSTWSWLFIVLFLFLTAFSFVNLIIGIVVNAIDRATSEEHTEDMLKRQETVEKDVRTIKHHVQKILYHHKIII